MKTVIFSTPRSGSTSFCRNFRRENKMLHFGEILNFTKYPRNGLTGRDYIQNQLEMWRNSENCFCKIFPFHISNEIPDISQAELLNYCKLFAEVSDNSIYVFRRNTTKQVFSSILSEYSGQWQADRDDNSEYSIDARQFHNYSLAILRNHKLVNKIKYQNPGKVYCVEDYLQDTPFQEYPHQHKNPDNYEYNLENIEKLYNYEKTIK